jgi:hypothetical protein
MPKQAIHIRVGKYFLKEVFECMKNMVKRIDDKNNQKHIKAESYTIFRKFKTRFPVNKAPKDFFHPFYVTRLMKPESQTITENGKERIAKYVSIFGFLRTMFLGILSGDPRIGYLSKRVMRYKKTQEISKLFEDFIRVYREEIGFNKKTLPKHILASANIFSACEQKPKNLCFPPKCEYIHHTRRSKGYCRTKKTRKNKKNKTISN